ncbi:MAG: MarR family transcriptional regulator [Bauldia litoralis]
MPQPESDNRRSSVDPGRSTLSAPEPLALVDLEGHLGFHLRLAQDASFRAFAGRAGVVDLRPGRYAAMVVIRNNPGITPIALSRAIVRDKSTVTPLVQDLERRNLVRRDRSTADRRSVHLTLTEEGEATLDALMEHADAHDRWLDAIVGDEKPQLLRLLRRIADALP